MVGTGGETEYHSTVYVTCMHACACMCACMCVHVHVVSCLLIHAKVRDSVLLLLRATSLNTCASSEERSSPHHNTRGVAKPSLSPSRIGREAGVSSL